VEKLQHFDWQNQFDVGVQQEEFFFLSIRDFRNRDLR